jgi:antitoxin HicB
MTDMKTVEHYMQLPYTIVMRRDEDGDIVARIDELSGCSAHGTTPAEALDYLSEVQRLWITEAINAGQTIPEPESEEELPSGKWVQRVPRTLHKNLAEMAKKEDVSLNQLVTSMLASAVTARSIGYSGVVEHHRPKNLHWGDAFAVGAGVWTVVTAVNDPILPQLENCQKLIGTPRRGKYAYRPQDISYESPKAHAIGGRK